MSDQEAAGLESGRQKPLDTHAQDVLMLLRSYSMKRKSPAIDFQDFVTYVKKYSQHYEYKIPRLKDFLQNTEKMLTNYLRLLEGEKNCRLEQTNGTIKAIHFNQFYTEVLRQAYKELEDHPDRPFPSEDQLELNMPNSQLTVINIKTDFVAALGREEADSTEFLRLVFPDTINSVIIASELITKKLLEYSVYKMREYLGKRNNAGYIMRKLIPALRGSEHFLREHVNSIVTRPGSAISSLLEPTDFSFRFWAHFANLIIQEFKEKKDKLPEEHGYCQAAYLLGYYNVYYRGLVQKKSEKQTALKNFEVNFRKAPYAFTLKDLYSIKDKKGLPLIRKSNRDVFLEFLENKTKSESYQSLPEIVRIKTTDKKEYYIHKDLVIPLFVKKLYETAKDAKAFYSEEWEKNLRENKRSLVMADDKEFENDLETVLKNRAPFYYSLLNYNLLYLAKEDGNITYEQSREMQRCFDEKQGKFRPHHELLGLNRKDILAAAKLNIPLWQRLGILRPLISALRMLFRRLRKNMSQARQENRRPKNSKPAVADRTTKTFGTAPRSQTAPVSASATATAQKAAYAKAVRELKVHFVGSGMTLSDKLDELIEKWNPIFDPQSRQDLIQDVNAMIRDYMRGMRKGFRLKPPGVDRIQAFAEKLAYHESFERITRKDFFQSYIEIYMVRLLGEK